MAWTTPRTWSAGAVVTAAQMNAHVRDNLMALLPLDALAWTSYTPTLTQSGSVTKTATYCKYTRLGNLVIGAAVCTATGAGSANNKVTMTLPVTAATDADQPIGSGFIVDSSVPDNNPGVVVIDTTTTMSMIDSTAATGAVRQGQTGTTFAEALANTDVVAMFFAYEAA